MGFLLLFFTLLLADTCPQYLSSINKAYREKTDHSLSEVSEFFDRPYAEILGSGYDLGHSYPHTLVKLGFKVQKNANGKTILVAPEKFETIVENSYKIVEELIQSGKITREQAVYPAVKYINPNRNIVLDGELMPDYIYIKAGVDVLPEGDWILDSHPGLDSHRVFYRAVDQGMAPIGLGDALFHDLAHYTDLLENPENMKQWRQYAKNLIHQKSGPFSFLFDFSKRKKAYASESRSLILSELFALPDIKKKDKIKALIPHYFDPSLKISEKQKYYEKLIKGSEEVLARYGGGMRDYVNIEALDSKNFTLSRINQELKKNWTIDSIGSIDETKAAMAESLMGLKHEIELLYQLRFQYEDTEKKLQKKLEGSSDVDLFYALKTIRSIPSEKRNLKIDKLLQEKVQRFETALYTAVKLDLDIETVYKEARVTPPPPGSKTYEYLKSYLLPKSFSYKAFELK